METDKEKLLELLESFGIENISYADTRVSFNGNPDLNIGDHWVDVDFIFTQEGKFKGLELHGD